MNGDGMTHRIVAIKALLPMLGIAAVVVPIFSQNGGAPAASPAFEVVSIKSGAPVLTRITIQTLGNRFVAEGFNLTAIVNSLSQQLGRPIIDKTGLDGLYDISLTWIPGAEQAPNPFALAPPAGAPAPPPSADPSGPSIFTALQEQLGLRLESSQGPVEVVVIDSAEKPAEN
jgi:hypothetical protein